MGDAWRVHGGKHSCVLLVGCGGLMYCGVWVWVDGWVQHGGAGSRRQRACCAHGIDSSVEECRVQAVEWECRWQVITQTREREKHAGEEKAECSVGGWKNQRGERQRGRVVVEHRS